MKKAKENKKFNMSYRNKILEKIFVTSLSFFILAILLLSGPAEAFIIALSSPNGVVFTGENVNFIASVSINQNELLNIDYLILNLNNANSSINCKFFPNGTIITGCIGMNIIQISSASYGYGYGYNNGYNYGYGFSNGILKYNITLNTTNYSVGDYNTRLIVAVDGKNYEQEGNKITIKSYQGGGGPKKINNACIFQEGNDIYSKNIRGNGGTLIIGNKFFQANQLKISVPNQKARPGSGYITSQKNRERFSYNFKIYKIEDDDNKSLIYVKGKYRIGRGKQYVSSSIIAIDKKISTASLIGDNMNLENMDVIFNGKDC